MPSYRGEAAILRENKIPTATELRGRQRPGPAGAGPQAGRPMPPAVGSRIGYNRRRTTIIEAPKAIELT